MAEHSPEDVGGPLPGPMEEQTFNVFTTLTGSLCHFQMVSLVTNFKTRVKYLSTQSTILKELNIVISGQF